MRLDASERASIEEAIVKKLWLIMKNEDSLVYNDIKQTYFGRLMLEDFNSLKEKVSNMPKALGKPLSHLEMSTLEGRVVSLEKMVKELSSSPDKLLRLSIDNFKMEKK